LERTLVEESLMADPASAMMGIGAGVQGVQGIAAGQQGKRAGQQLDRQMEGQTDLLGNVIDQGQGMLDTVMGMDPSFGGQREMLYDQAMTGGQQLSGTLNNLAGRVAGVGDAGAGAYGQQLANMGDAGASAYGQQLAGLGTGNVSGVANQLSSMPGAQFNFRPGSNMMDQSMAAFQDMSGNIRNQASDVAAQQFTAGGNALDAALASRGISRGSGVAAGATRDMALQGAQQLAGVERDLANMGTQMGLDATQFDVGRVLQEQGMQSNFALGSAAQRGQNLLGAGQLGLGAAGQQAQNLAQAGNLALGSASQLASNLGNAGQLALGSAGQQAANLGQAGSLASQAYAMPLGMQQDMFSQNYMNPMLQQQGMMG
jgi:hypothetical protein